MSEIEIERERDNDRIELVGFVVRKFSLYVRIEINKLV